MWNNENTISELQKITILFVLVFSPMQWAVFWKSSPTVEISKGLVMLGKQLPLLVFIFISHWPRSILFCNVPCGWNSCIFPISNSGHFFSSGKNQKIINAEFQGRWADYSIWKFCTMQPFYSLYFTNLCKHQNFYCSFQIYFLKLAIK